jgi:integrase
VLETLEFSQRKINQILKKLEDFRKARNRGGDEFFLPEGVNVQYIKDERNNGAKLILKITKTGSADFIIRERVKTGSKKTINPQRFKVASINQSLREVTARAQEMQQNIMAGRAVYYSPDAPKPGERDLSPTFQTLHDDYLAHHSMRASTRKAYFELFNRYLLPWSELKISQLTPREVLRLHTEITNNGGAKKRVRAPDQAIGYARTLINSAIKNPDPDYTKPSGNIIEQAIAYHKSWIGKGGQAEVTGEPVDDENWHELWEAISDLKNRVPNRNDKKRPTLAVTSHYYFKMSLLTGLRGGQLSSIEWRQIDLERGTITWKEKEDVEKTKTGEKVFNLPVCHYIWDMLKEMRDREIELTGKCDGYLFKSLGNGKSPHVTENMPTQWRVIKKQVPNIAHHKPHDIRATFVTIGQNLDVHQTIIQMLINHKTYEKTKVIEIYTKRGREEVRQKADKIANHFLEHIGEKTKAPEPTPLPEYLMRLANSEAIKTDMPLDQVLERWLRMGSQIDKIETDDPQIELLKRS